VSTEVTPDIATVIPLRFRSGEGRLRRAILWFADMPILAAFTREADLVIEAFPILGGLPAFALLRPQRGRWAIYCASEGARLLDRIAVGGPIRTLLRANYELSFATELRLADAVFVRDAGQVDTMRRVNPRVHVSAPVLSMPPPGFARDAGRRQGGELRLLYVGRLLAGKGLEDTMEAVARLRSAGRKASLDLVGGSPEAAFEASLRDRAARLGVGDHVRFHGWVDDPDSLWRAYGGADVFVLASMSEGFPRVLDEAAIAGLPIVTTPVGGIGKTLSDGREALLVPVEDPAAIAAAVERIAGDPTLRDRLVAGARASVKARYPLDAADQHATLPFV
jgi:glycosyltransferase involved in cell wall biosynthesis